MTPAMCRRLLCLPLVLALNLASAGCVFFEKQTVYLEFSKDKDEAHALLVYYGLYATAQDKQGLMRDQEILTDMAKDNRIFIVADPLLQADLDPNKATDPLEAKWVTLANNHLTVRKGVFGLDKDGKLIYTQRFTFRNVSKFIDGANRLISEHLQNAKQPNFVPPKDKDEAKLRAAWNDQLDQMQAAAKKGHAWMKLKDGQLILESPATPFIVQDVKASLLQVKQYAQLYQMIDRVKTLVTGSGDPKGTDVQETLKGLQTRLQEMEYLSQFLAEAPISVEQRAKSVKVAVGLGDYQPLELSLRRAMAKKSQSLVDHAKTLGVEFRQNVTVDGLIDEFKQSLAKKK